MNETRHQQKISLEKAVSKAELVSFDFFDTLFVRPLCHAEDVFDILAKKFELPGFRALRKEAQTKAFQKMHERQRKEITLADIYECFSECGVHSERLMNAEYALELKLVSPNPELIDLYNRLVEEGKRVVIVSDMYLTEDFFVKALSQYQLKQVPLYISANQNATKRDFGDLFDVMLESEGVGAADVVHVGDNEHADVKQARIKKLNAFHYKQTITIPKLKKVSPEASTALGLIQAQPKFYEDGSAEQHGFLYGGPATYAYLKWIEQQAAKDNVDHVLFMARDGFLLNQIVKDNEYAHLKNAAYFLGSRIAFTLAAITESNFVSYLPFLLSGSDGLSPFEVLARIGVESPSPEVMMSLGLNDDATISLESTLELQRFLYAYRWEILKVCRRNRQALFQYLLEKGISDGDKVAIVDVGWSGSTQEAFEVAIDGLMDVDVVGYYFCLAETDECIARRQRYDMSALVSVDSVGEEVIAGVYKNRVAIEAFFSAPHHTVIGLESSPNGVVAVEDSGRGTAGDTSESVRAIIKGGNDFYNAYSKLIEDIELSCDLLNLASPMIDFAINSLWLDSGFLREMKNFDTWASSKNKRLDLSSYT